MGFPIEVDGEHWVSFRVGASILALRTRTLGAPWEDGEAPAGSAAAQLAFRVPPPAVDACHAELAAKGVCIVREPADIPNWRHRALFLRDPEGNLLEIYAEY